MTTQADKRKLYRTMTQQQILASMSNNELRRNVRRGAVAAISEMERRTRIDDLIQNQGVR